VGQDLTADERKVLARLQRGFPLVADPYAGLGRELGLPADEVFSIARGLCQRGVIRRLGPVFDARGLGYVSTLLGVKVRLEALDSVVSYINDFPEVTHNYQRDHEVNVWCAILAADEARLRRVVRSIAACEGVEETLELPVLRRYKLRLHFPIGAGEEEADA